MQQQQPEPSLPSSLTPQRTAIGQKGAFLLAVTNVKCQEEFLAFQLLLAVVPEVSQSGEGAVDTGARQ